MDEICRCRWFGFGTRPHLCAKRCGNPDHGADELDYLFALAQPVPLQLRLF